MDTLTIRQITLAILGPAIAGGAVYAVLSLIKVNTNAKRISSVVVGLVGFFVVVFGLQKWGNLPADLESELLKHQVYREIRDHRPVFFRSLVSKGGKLMQERGDARLVAEYIRGEMMPLVNDLLPKTSDSAAHALIITELLVWKNAIAIDTELCYQLFSDRTKLVNFDYQMPEELTQMEITGLGAVARDAFADPQPVVEEEDIMDDLLPIQQGLFEKYGPDVMMFDFKEHPPEVHGRFCVILIDFYERIVDLPTERAGPLIRFLMRGLA